MREVTEKINECNHLHEELAKRPFEIKGNAEVIDTSLHPKLTDRLQELLKSNTRFYVKILINSERFWVIPIGRSDSHNANFDNSEEGQIFVGVVDNQLLNDKIKFNDLVEFQSCDVLDIKNA